MVNKTQNLTRYYVSQSCIFSERPYDVPAIQAIVKTNGGKNVRACNQFGWSNQPKVVTWNSDYDTKKKINEALKSELPAFKNTIAVPVIFSKDWK